MTDRIRHLTVVLDQDYRDDDVQRIVDAIRMTRGVESVGLNVADADAYVARETAKSEMRQKIQNFLKTLWRDE